MRHRKSGRKLGRNSSHRAAMWRNMVTSLLEHGQIRTTEAKAKELRRFVEPTIARAIKAQAIATKPVEERTAAEKSQLVHAIRMVGRLVRDKGVITRLFNELAPAMKDRPGGFTRIVKMAPRPGDAAPMALIALVDLPKAETEAAA